MVIPNHLTECESMKNDLIQEEQLPFAPESGNICMGGNDCCSLKEHGILCNQGEGSCSEDEDCKGTVIYC